MLCGGVLMLIAGFAFGERMHDVADREGHVLGRVSVAFGSIVAFSAYVWLLHHVRTTLAGSYAYVNPVIAVVLGAWLAAERFTAHDLGAMAVILLGVVAITLGKAKNEARVHAAGIYCREAGGGAGMTHARGAQRAVGRVRLVRAVGADAAVLAPAEVGAVAADRRAPDRVERAAGVRLAAVEARPRLAARDAGAYRASPGCWRLSGVLIGFNWGLYIWAVNAGHVVETSLGYFINPLLNVVIGVLFLRERLRPVQWVSVAIATGGVLWLTLHYGSFPWIALALAASFALYGLIRKLAAVAPIRGLGIESAYLFLPALALLLWSEAQGQGGFLPLNGAPAGVWRSTRCW